MMNSMVKIEKPDSYRGYPVSNHNHIYYGDAVMTDSILTKICSKCQVEKPVSEFHKMKKGKYGVRSFCKPCASIDGKAYYEKNIEQIHIKQAIYQKTHHAERRAYGIKYRKNNYEKLKKYQDEYYKNNREEVLIKQKHYHENNRDESRAKSRLYYKNNHEETLIKHKHYRENNRDKCRASNRLHYKNNREECLSRGRLHYKNNREKICESHRAYKKTEAGISVRQKAKHKRRAVKYGVGYESFSSTEIFERDNYTCQICGIKTRPDFKNQYHPKRPNLDHIIPLSKGGEHSKKNVQCLCRQCNFEKHNKEDFGDQIRLF